MKFHYGSIVLEIPNEVYYPREDSLLMAKAIEGLAKGKCLDMGTGSGFLAIVMARQGAAVTAADIDQHAIRTAKTNAALNGARINVIRSDLFSNVKGSYDFIAFNAPYLPARGESLQWSGGKTGRAVIKRFLSGAGNHLKKDGTVLLAISSLTGESEVMDMFIRNGFSPLTAAREKIPWEELLVIQGSK